MEWVMYIGRVLIFWEVGSVNVVQGVPSEVGRIVVMKRENIVELVVV